MAAFDEKYDRLRRDPAPGTLAYPHLKDLVEALRPRLARARGLWLDFGSGTSPYRELFGPEAKLVRADIPLDGAPPPDYAIERGRPCPAEDATFDGVLSTQVLQHVPDPDFYLRDAFRMLRPGGELLLTTHGVWHDHPCPVDYRRWTAQGLRLEVERAGLEVIECVPLTSSLRGVVQLMALEFNHTPWDRAYLSPVGLLMGALRLISRRRPASMNRFADRLAAGDGRGDDGRSSFYLALLVTARRPA